MLKKWKRNPSHASQKNAIGQRRYRHAVVSSIAIKHFCYQKLVRLINHVRIYGSNVAEGFFSVPTSIFLKPFMLFSRSFSATKGRSYCSGCIKSFFGSYPWMCCQFHTCMFRHDQHFLSIGLDRSYDLRPEFVLGLLLRCFPLCDVF